MGKGAKPILDIQFQDLFGGAHAFVKDGVKIPPSSYLACNALGGSYGISD